MQRALLKIQMQKDDDDDDDAGQPAHARRRAPQLCGGSLRQLYSGSPAHSAAGRGGEAGAQQARLQRVEEKVDRLMAGLGDFSATIQREMQAIHAAMAAQQAATEAAQAPTRSHSS